MPDENDKSSIGRRNVLKAIGGISAATTLSTAVQALSGPEKDERIEVAIQTDSFQKFEAEFGSIAVDPEGSSVTRLGDGDDLSERVELKTNLGKMGVILVDEADVSFDITLLDLSTVVDGAVPAEYTNVPEDTRPLLLATSDHDGFEFRRDATEAEKRELAKMTGIPEAEIEANLESEVGGFVVADSREVEDGEYLVVELDEFVFHELTMLELAGATVVDEPVTPQWSWWCTWKCGSCLTKAAGCVGCCLAATLGCIACIIWKCGLGAKACYDCYTCF